VTAAAAAAAQNILGTGDLIMAADVDKMR